MNDALASNQVTASWIIDMKGLHDLSYVERRRLRELTNGTADSHMLSVLREGPSHVRCFLARHGDEIIGWSLARWYKPFSERPRNAHISVFVAPAWRRRGLGRALTEAAVSFAARQGLVPWVSAVQHDQLDFYRACAGAAQICRVPFQTK